MKRAYPKKGNFLSSPISGKGLLQSSNQLNATTVQSVSNPKQSNINEMFSQTSKFSRGNRVNNGGEGLQQSSMGAVDMLVDLTDGGNGN